MDTFALLPSPVDNTPRYGELCCVECFEDRWLRQQITNRSREMGRCEFCETEGIPVIEVSYLTSYFLNMTEMYSRVSSDNTIMALVDPVDAGEFLHYLIQDDWEVFSEGLVDRDQQENLLTAILNARYTDAEWMRQAKEESPFDSSELYTSRQNPADYRLVDVWDTGK